MDYNKSNQSSDDRDRGSKGGGAVSNTDDADTKQSQVDVNSEESDDRNKRGGQSDYGNR